MTNTIILVVIAVLLLLRLIILYLVYVQGKPVKKCSLLSIDDEYDQHMYAALCKKVQDKPTSILCQDLKSEHIEKEANTQEVLRDIATNVESIVKYSISEDDYDKVVIDKSKHKDESYFAFFERMLDDKAANMVANEKLFFKYKVTAAMWKTHSLPEQKRRLKELQVACQKAATKKFRRRNDSLT
jgi:hypothetical protein